MLVLTRQLDQSIIIGDDIQITVVEVKGDKIRLGIKAPRDVQVHRSEIYDAIHAENAAATNVRVPGVARRRTARRSPISRTPLDSSLTQPLAPARTHLPPPRQPAA